MTTTILITGGCGFIGHHLVEHVLKNTDYDVLVVDKLTYAACGFDRLRDINVFDDKRVRVLTADIAEGLSEGLVKECRHVDYLVHMAAETHVDNSIRNPERFVKTNVLGTANVLGFTLQLPRLKRFVYFSTDEVFGPALLPSVSSPAHQGNAATANQHLWLRHRYEEWDRYNCTNPYSATKAGGEELVLAYSNTYGLPVFITHTMNAFGERQHPEKFVPLCIRDIMAGATTKIHADPSGKISGSRSYIHCRNIADGIMFLLANGTGNRAKYNIVGEQEVANERLYKLIRTTLMNLGAANSNAKYKLVDFHSSRPGHDLRYALSGHKMARLGWEPPVSFSRSLANTVEWFINNPQWLDMEVGNGT